MNTLQIDTGAFAQLRGYKVDLTIRDTKIEVFPSSAFNTLTAINFLSLSLQNNHLQTFEPFPHTKPPVLNQHGTILYNLQLTVGIQEIIIIYDFLTDRKSEVLLSLISHLSFKI